MSQKWRVWVGNKEKAMGKKLPKYMVFNMNISGEYHVPVDYGDNLDILLAKYHGKAYQVMNVQSVAKQEEE